MPNIQIFNGVIPSGERGDGCLPMVLGDCAELPRVADDWLLPDDEIRRRLLAIKDIVLGYANAAPWIYQGNQGSCCPSTYGHCIMQLNAEEGEPAVLLSQATLYAWAGIDSDGNLIKRRYDNGMALRTGILLGRKLGMAPVDVIPAMSYQRPEHWPSNWRVHADDHKIVEWRQLTSLRAIGSALARGLPVAHGYAGHARCIVWKDPDGNIYHCKNSWQSQKWHYLTERQVDEGRRQYEAFSPITSVAA